MQTIPTLSKTLLQTDGDVDTDTPPMPTPTPILLEKIGMVPIAIPITITIAILTIRTQSHTPRTNYDLKTHHSAHAPWNSSPKSKTKSLWAPGAVSTNGSSPSDPEGTGLKPAEPLSADALIA